MKITVTINGEAKTYNCEPHESLRAVLRREGYFSVRFGAETGETGADAVLLDGRLVSSEVLLAAQGEFEVLAALVFLPGDLVELAVCQRHRHAEAETKQRDQQ